MGKETKDKKDMTVIRQPGKWNVRLFPGGAVAGPLLCMKACCFPCWGLGSLAASRGESCLKWGCFAAIPPLTCICHYRLRRDIKSDHGMTRVVVFGMRWPSHFAFAVHL